MCARCGTSVLEVETRAAEEAVELLKREQAGRCVRWFGEKVVGRLRGFVGYPE